MSSSGSSVVEIEGDGLTIGVLPHLGGAITHVTWAPAGARESAPIELMRRGSAEDIASGNPSRLASFVMVPFANRIDAGRIPVRETGQSERVEAVPVNRPAQNAAIHGFGRLAPWAVAERTTSHVLLRQHFAEPGNPYVYEAGHRMSIGAGVIACTLSVTNRGPAAMPFGLGFHPWFDRTPEARLSFVADTAFRMDDRDMPLEAVPLDRITGHAAQGGGAQEFVVSSRTPFDTPVAGWRGKATLTWPEHGAALDIEADAALGILHIFAPKEPAVFCVEPVSHMPDVVNRRQLVPYGDMRLLASGQSMAGTMRLRPRLLAGA